MFRRLLERFELTNRRHALLKKGDRIVVGVSGGPDSLALLEFLKTLGRKYALTLSVAHLDHGLQKNSRKTSAFVRKAAESRGLPFYGKKVNVRARALRDKLSLEDAGRKERYRFFEEVAKKTRANKLATAHTLDDQSETMLMRLMRGSGLRGLAGIPYKRMQGRFEVVRPLLDCPKKDLVAWLKKERIAFVEDPMNDDPVFLRNRVRHTLLPLLKRRFNPQIQQALASLQDVCRQAQDYLHGQAGPAFRRCLKSSKRGDLVLDVGRLRALHPALRYEVLAAAAAKFQGDLAGFGYAHWEAADSLLASSQKKPETHWPHRIRVRKMGGRLVISAP